MWKHGGYQLFIYCYVLNLCLAFTLVVPLPSAYIPCSFLKTSHAYKILHKKKKSVHPEGHAFHLQFL